MANELDKTIEELEAEVLEELKRLNMGLNLKPNATATDPMQKVKEKSRRCKRGNYSWFNTR